MGETDNPKGAATTQTPEGTDGQTPETVTLPRKEVESLRATAHAASTDYKRLEAEFRRSQSVAEAALNRLKAIEEAQMRQEEEDAKDDPAKLSAMQIRREAIKAKQEAEEAMRKAETATTELQTQRQENRQYRADKLAETYNVQADILVRYGGDSKDSMEELAKSYGTRPKAGNPAGKPPVTVYSGKTSGGGAPLNRGDIAKMTPAERKTRAAEIAAIPFG